MWHTFSRRPLLWCLLQSLLFVALTGCGGCGGPPRPSKLAKNFGRDRDDAAAQAKASAPAQAVPGAVTPAPSAAPGAVSPSPAPGAPGAAKPIGELPQGGASKVLVPPLPARLELTREGARRRVLTAMEKVGKALGDYVRKNGRYPRPASFSPDGQPLLSWRVHLLPYLGHEEFYEEFHKNEPWNSPHNSSLLAKIPPEYEMPSRRDERTNLLLPVGAATLFASPAGFTPDEVTDGIANTVMLLEVDNDRSVPWTQPVDLAYYEDRDPKSGLGGLREDGFFVVWANAKVGRVPLDAADANLRAMFTARGGERFALADVHREATGEPAVVARHAAARPVNPDEEPDVRVPVKPAVGPAGVGAVVGAGNAGSAVRLPSGENVKERLPLPSEEAQQKSQTLFKQIYRKEYEDAKSAQQKYDLAKKLLDQAAKLRDDAAGRYVLLGVAGKVAAEAGDAATAMNVADKILADFDVRPLDVKGDLLLKVSKHAPRNKESDDKLAEEGNKMLTLALLDDNFTLALELYAAALGAARRNNKEKTTKDKSLEDLADRRREIEQARVAYAKVEKVVDALAKNPDDPDHNLTVGKYFCFIKRNWERGLPMLASGSDDTLRRLARAELNRPISPEEQTQLGDDWWERSERESEKSGLRKEMQLRAVNWYLAATPRLPAGLLQVKVEVRIKEAEKSHGKEAVEQIRLASGKQK